MPVSATGSYKGGANPPAGTDIADRLGAVKRLAFKPGAVQKSVSVVVYPDQLAEGDETFEIRLTNPAGGVSLGRAVAVGTIVDDEPPGA